MRSLIKIHCQGLRACHAVVHGVFALKKIVYTQRNNGMKNKFFHKLAKAVKAILSLRIVLRRASFEVTLLISILIHVLLFGWISTSKNFADDEELPVKARVNVRYGPPKSSPPLPKKPALYQSDLSNFSMVKLQPMVQKLPMLKPKLHNLVPKKPVLKKPALKNIRAI